MKTFFTATIASVLLAGIAAAGTVNFSNFGSTWEIQASGTPISGGFVAVGTGSGVDFSDPAAAQTALAANFTQFGDATDFGGAAAFNLNGFFSGALLQVTAEVLILVVSQFGLLVETEPRSS